MRQRLLQWTGIITSISLILIVFNSLGILDAIIRPVQPILEKPLSGLSGVFRSITDSIRVSTVLPSTIKTMEQTITQLRIENEQYRHFEIENIALRKQLDFKKRDTHTIIYAHVIGMSSETGTNLMIIDKGSDDGIKEQSAVTTGNGMYVGQIVKTRNLSSYVRLPNNDKSNIIVSIIKDGVELSGIVHGSFQTGIVLDRVEQKKQLMQGDSVMTSALNSTIPPGLFIGTVNDITSTPNDLFQQTTIIPAQPLDTVRTVGVIAPR
ncbi:MAG: rod shape-determining protein MreC [Patescibacteria group bacterium]